MVKQDTFNAFGCTYIHTYVRMYISMLCYNSLILFIAILLDGPDPNAFTAVTTTLTSLSTAGKSIVAIRVATAIDPFITFCPK